MTTSPQARRSARPQDSAVLHTYETLIVGAGFAGLGSAIRLRRAGIRDIVILERGNAVGGTWRDNQYPGAACDIPSNLYSYSFAPNPEWSRAYSGSREILSYIGSLVRQYELAPLIRFGQEVIELAFDKASRRWLAKTAAGQTYGARTVVMAQGPLSNARFPDMPGIGCFEGHKIHSARWDHGYDFAGKRVAVIGTGASAIQIIPEMVKQAGFVKVFQRTPGWVLPRPDYGTPDWMRALFRRAPAAQSALRQVLYGAHESMATGLIWRTPASGLLEQVARLHLRSQVQDDWMRRQLTPDHRIGCKRVLVSNDYYPSLQQPNAKLITWPIATLSPRGIRTVEGVEHQADCIVFATGFDVSKTGTPFPVHGLGGRLLSEEWQRGAQAYRSVSVAGYPNLFFTFGPNSGPGHNSALVYLESQIDYIVQGVRLVIERDLKWLDVHEGAQQRYNAAIQRRLAGTNWNSGCKSWYLTGDGFNGTMYPGFATQYRLQMRRLPQRDYSLVR
ncbi:4-hydroxyacetophenone monooxygenase [Solimonas fluminis]|uniref:4-hydroxyacetophenone monooxygenase n=1 Tax=Solimonas fluminis TaxID=2086571 RepID=A0A2S5TKP7_9GAMM|nr:NAD(P)/FAD-dependent oxidoreductase [Solimonas fluminis]PPE75569.1 4-hydroxyacetophenone monooxygenase [Solimonas fluminis]